MLREAMLVCQRELRRNLRSAKGLAAVGLFSLGGAASTLLYVNAQHFFDEQGAALPPEARAEFRRRALLLAYDGDTAVAEYLSRAPTVLLFFFHATLFFLPLLTILAGYDTLAGELQHRTVRYAATRARRESLVIGRVLALWLGAGAISLVPSALTWVWAFTVGHEPVSETLSYGARFWLMTFVFSAAYAGLTTLVSSMFRTPILALLTTVGTGFGLWVLRMVLSLQSLPSWLRSARYALPGAWEDKLLSPRLNDFGLGSLACLGFCAACTTLACVALRKRDL